MDQPSHNNQEITNQTPDNFYAGIADQPPQLVSDSNTNSFVSFETAQASEISDRMANTFADNQKIAQNSNAVSIDQTIKPQENAVDKSVDKSDERVSSFVPLESSEEKSSQKKQQITFKIFEQKINSANQLKQSGNAFFKEKNYVQAIRQYSEALRLLDPTYFYGASKEQCQQMAQISANLLCNMGFCYFNSHDMQKAQLFFTQAIAINPKYTKALHKRALSRFQLQKYEEAFEDIKLAFSLEKSNADIHHAYSKILEKYNEQMKKEKEKMKELSEKIFNNQSQKTISPRKQTTKKQKSIDPKSEVGQHKQGGWNLFSTLSFAGAAALIGIGLYRAFKI